MMFFIIIYCLLVNSIAALGFGRNPTKDPSEDEFYNPPKGFESKPVGTILRSRVEPGRLSNFLVPINVDGAWQILIRSQDSLDEPNVIAATIIKPYNADPEKLISYQPFEDGITSRCAPSYAIQLGSPFQDMATQLEMFNIDILLNQGYYVVIPDYEGPDSAFGAGKQAGYAILNTIKATLSSSKLTGLDPDANTIIYGYSGGGFSSAWASMLQPSYAPKLKKNLIGAVIGGMIANTSAMIEVNDGTIFAGIIPNVLNGLAHQYTELQEFIRQKLNPKHADKFYNTSECLFDAIVKWMLTTFFSGHDPFFPDGISILNLEPLKTILNDNNIVDQSINFVPQIPIFIYHGSLDKICPVEDARTTFNNWCSLGLKSGEFSEDKTSGHFVQTVIGTSPAVTWIIGRMNGKPPVDGCTHKKRITSVAYPRAFKYSLGFIKTIIKALVGFRLGPKLKDDTVDKFDNTEIASFMELGEKLNNIDLHVV
ncbi:hypothetical protein KGF54_005643 [Candida jiufengensis]|uniref:uncharacterized protein n=1 Tax=Candida jiufengensis TaxID=497108 RepID=UPI0022244E31|nr:uncharacterized protein KGF54_005643 [Candida jiufengensis]KAI5949408.1 hypothetical protein KGF54_005643 [Candida jiufengensis]